MKRLKYINNFLESNNMDNEEQGILDILNKHFNGQNGNIKAALKDFRVLYDIKRSDPPMCPKCKSGIEHQSSLGKWETGVEYRCDNCSEEWEYNFFD